METVRDSIFLGSKITADFEIKIKISACSHEIKHLLLGKKAITKLDCVEKQRHHFVNKVLIVKAMGE